MITPNELNYIARTAFRDIADQDYIAARICYKLQLPIQFCWLAQQAIEKYLKATLLFNGQKADNLSHNIDLSLKRLRENNYIQFILSKNTEEFIDYINEYGKSRYLEGPVLVFDNELAKLDRAVWELRLYCKSIGDLLVRGEIKYTQKEEVADIHQWFTSNEPHKHKLHNGYLEKILSSKNNPQRKSLIWSNQYFGTRKNNIKPKSFVNMRVPVHGFDKSKAQELKDYMTIPGHIIKKLN